MPLTMSPMQRRIWDALEVPRTWDELVAATSIDGSRRHSGGLSRAVNVLREALLIQFDKGGGPLVKYSRIGTLDDAKRSLRK